MYIQSVRGSTRFSLMRFRNAVRTAATSAISLTTTLDYNPLSSTDCNHILFTEII
nr:MAG TPA: hypothetical protein [Caudoviricetes sp.]